MGADLFGDEVVEGEAQAFPDRFKEEGGGFQKVCFDFESDNDEVYRVHVGDGILKEDGLVWGPARGNAPEAGGYVGIQIGADAAQEDGPQDLHLCDCTH